MKEYTTSKARILFVSVPEDAIKVDTTDLSIRYVFKNGMEKEMFLPDGDWVLLSLLKDATEEKAASVVDSKQILTVSDDGSTSSYVTYYYAESEHLHMTSSRSALMTIANHLGCEGNQAILIEPNK